MWNLVEFKELLDLPGMQDILWRSVLLGAIWRSSQRDGGPQHRG